MAKHMSDWLSGKGNIIITWLRAYVEKDLGTLEMLD
jgi:hypothetical protein